MTDNQPGMTAAPTGPTDFSGREASLQANCAQCAGLCCVALAFARPAGFAFDKDAGEPCHNLQDDFRCGIHAVLRERGFPGCTVFDCQGAGQKVTQITFGGRTWRDDPAARETMFATFQVMRPLQELLFYLNDALSRPSARPLQAELVRSYDEIDQSSRLSADEVLGVDVGARRKQVGALLGQASALVRADAARGRKPSKAAQKARPGADLAGLDLAGADLRGVDLRGAQLIATGLQRADLRGADLIGADLRDADLCGADGSEALYLTQFQVNAARGDVATQIPARLTRPAHWPS